MNGAKSLFLHGFVKPLLNRCLKAMGIESIPRRIQKSIAVGFSQLKK